MVKGYLDARTCHADDDFLVRDPGGHAQKDLMSRMEVVESSSHGHNRVRRR